VGGEVLCVVWRGVVGRGLCVQFGGVEWGGVGGGEMCKCVCVCVSLSFINQYLPHPHHSCT